MRDEGFLSRIRKRFTAPSGEAARERLLVKYEDFRRLVEANTSALETMADMQVKASGEYLFDRAYVDSTCRRVIELGDEVASSLVALSDGRHRGVREANERISRCIREEIFTHSVSPSGPPVLELRSLREVSAELVGAKTHRLAEILLDAGLPVPDGFSITSAACRCFLEKGGLLSAISEEVASLPIAEKEALKEASDRIKGRLTATPWPEELAREIMSAHRNLEERQGGASLVSVRSSAVGEDGEFSFAGQYGTVLNVGRDGLLKACTEVLASQFSPRALVYFKARGFSEALLPMAIGVIAMIDARASGVLYTRDPQHPGSDDLTVAGLWGLGSLTVDGSLTPDLFTLSRGENPEIRQAKIAHKDRMLLCREGVGLTEVEVPGWMRAEPCLTKDQLSLLASYGQKLEDHFGRPQDIEWALDARENIYILQSRPLRISAPPSEAPDVMALRQGLTTVLREGVVACRGCAAGEVFLLERDDDLPKVPKGAVLVARAASPPLAETMDRVAAIVTDSGSSASHLATVAREFGVPAIFDTKNGTSVLASGEVVTVDGDMGSVYKGRAEALLAAVAAGNSREAAETPLLKRFRSALRHITPLNLTDPRSGRFRASHCKTVHDVLRFSHEMAVQEMFLAGGRFSRGTKGALKLVGGLPVDFYFIDLGGGLKTEPEAKTVTPEDFSCRPLLPLWQGMVQVPWTLEAAATGRAMASVMMTSLTSRDALERMAEPNFVLVSESYLNLSFRLGYHFSRVDALLSDRADDNYASFLFHGGAADAGGRSRRVRFMAEILGEAGFRATAREDALFCRTERTTPDEMGERLTLLGRLLVVTRQIDTLLVNDAAADRAIEAFRAGDYTLGLTGEEVSP